MPHDVDAAFNRAFKGMSFKRNEAERAEAWGGHKHTTWNRKLRNRLANAPKKAADPKGGWKVR